MGIPRPQRDDDFGGEMMQQDWTIPTRFTVGIPQGLTREDMIRLRDEAQRQCVDPRELAARLIVEGLRRIVAEVVSEE